MEPVNVTAFNEAGRAHGLGDGYDAWKRDVQGYTETKKNFQGVAEPYKKVTTAHVKQQEVKYNPITQKFTDPSRETQVRNIETDNMVDVLAQNKVRILNLADLSDHPSLLRRTARSATNKPTTSSTSTTN